LAYLTAKTNARDDLALEILEAAGLTEADVDDIPSYGTSALKPPSVLTSTTDSNWPSVSVAENFFDRALANGHLEGGTVAAYPNGIDAAGTAASSALDAWAKEETQEDIDPEEGGWELDADGGATTEAAGDDEVAQEEDKDLGAAGAALGVSEIELWVRNSPFAADHVAAGSFETALQVRLHLCPLNAIRPNLITRYSFSADNSVS
jgi:coatomer protein complex subunit alpha (xenin)